MDLIDEQYFSPFERGQDACQVSRFLQGRPRCDFDSNPHFIRDDEREGRFAKPRGTSEQNVIERFAPALCGRDENPKVVDDLPLTDKLLKP